MEKFETSGLLERQVFYTEPGRHAFRRTGKICGIVCRDSTLFAYILLDTGGIVNRRLVSLTTVDPTPIPEEG